MGITGLLQNTRSIQTPFRISSIKGKKVAVDGMGWLHLALYPVAEEIYYGKPYLKQFVRYFMARVVRLLENNIDVIIVFDGMKLPAKLNTHVQRSDRIQTAKDNAKKNLHIDADIAKKHMQSAVKISSVHIDAVQKELQLNGVEFMVAPFESDSQLTYLCKNKLVDYVITEDSDLMIYGCPKIIFKLDKIEQGQGFLVDINDIGKCKEMNFKNWSMAQFRTFGILCGCDYLDNIKGIGPKRANELVNKFKTIDKVVYNIRTMKSTVPAGYLVDFKRVEKMFIYQYVFDPRTKKIVHLTPVPETFMNDVDNWDLGLILNEKDGELLCTGKKNPRDFQKPINSQSSDVSVEVVEKENVSVCPLTSNPPKKRHFEIAPSESNLKISSNIEFRQMINQPKKVKKQIQNPFFKKWLNQGSNEDAENK